MDRNECVCQGETHNIRTSIMFNNRQNEQSRQTDWITENVWSEDFKNHLSAWSHSSGSIIGFVRASLYSRQWRLPLPPWQKRILPKSSAFSAILPLRWAADQLARKTSEVLVKGFPDFSPIKSCIESPRQRWKMMFWIVSSWWNQSQSLLLLSLLLFLLWITA